jgi:flagellar motor switch protein FliG
MVDKVKEKQTFSSLDKAAVLISSLDEDTAAKVLNNLSPREIRLISHRMAQMEHIPSGVVIAASTEFIEMAGKGGGIIEAGINKTKNLLNKALGHEQASLFIENLGSEDPSIDLAMMESVGNLDPKILANFVKGEHPQTIAIILANLPPDKAAAVMTVFTQEMKNEVIQRIAELQQVPGEILSEIANVLKKELQITASVGREMGGTKTVAEILNALDSSSEKQVLAHLEEDNPSLAEEVRKLMFVFEDLAFTDDRGIQQLLREIDSKTLCTALRAAGDEIKDKFLRNMSERAAEMMVEDMETMGPTRLSEIERCQQEVIRVAKRLEEQGKIIVGGKGSDEVFI